MSNLTLALEDETLKSARKVAIDRGTSVNQLVRQYIGRLVAEADTERLAQQRLNEILDRGICEVGPIRWSRDSLHER